MNKLETAEAILVMQAWIDGEEIKRRLRKGNGRWNRMAQDDFYWDWALFEYKVREVL